MSDRTSSWPVRIACVTIPPALALAAIYYVSHDHPLTAALTSRVDAVDQTNPTESAGDLSLLTPTKGYGEQLRIRDEQLAMFAMREAGQAHRVFNALKVMAYSSVDPNEIAKINRNVIDEITRAVMDEMKETSIPHLRGQIEESKADREYRALLEAIVRLQQLVVAEAEALRHYAVADSPEAAQNVLEAMKAYQKQASELTRQLDGKVQ